MAGNRMRRMAKELADIQVDTHSQVMAEPIDGDDLTHLRGSFPGPPGTPYEGGTYYIDIIIPTDYPFRPPTMSFQTKVWHPNVSSQTGVICLDTLGSAWSPVLTVKSALLSLQSLLSTPEPKDPQDAEVANMMLKRPKEFERVARTWAVTFAGAPSTSTAAGASDDIENTQAADAKPDLARYDGYNQDMIERFCSMGFQSSRVVSAFQALGMDRMGGEEYELDEPTMANIIGHLLGE